MMGGPLLWMLGLVHAVLAADLLEETRGVLGRGVGPIPGGELAALLVEQDRWTEAAAMYRPLAAAGSPEAALWSVVASVRAGDPQGAQEATFAALEISPGDPRVVLAAAWLLNEGGAHREAAKLLRDYPAGAPDAAGATVLRMRSAMMLGKPRRAQRLRRQALERGAVDAWFWFEAGLEDIWLERDGATDTIRQATRSQNAGGMHYQLLLQHLRETTGVEAAVAAGLEGMARFPDHMELAGMMAELCRYGDGRAALEAVVAGDPQAAVARRLLGIVLLAEDEPATAAEHLQAAMDGGLDQPEMYRLLAEAHLAAEAEPAAWRALAGGVERHPEDPYLWRELFSLGEQAARVGDALEISEAAWQKGVHQGFLVDFSYEAASDIEALDVALRWSERSAGLSGRRWRGLLQRALTLTQLGRGEEALRAYEEALLLKPNEPQLLNNLAWFLLEPATGVDRDVERALRLAEQAVRVSSEPRAAYLDTLARALWETGDQERAVALQREAAALEPDNEYIRNTLQQYETSE